MGNYVHDWQPQRINGIPGGPHYAADHADGNGHNHFGFKTQEQAREIVRFLRERGIRVTEWAGDGGQVTGHRDPGHGDGRSFDVPASQWSPTPDRAKEIEGMRRVEMLTDDFLRSKGVPDAALPYLARSQPAAGQGAPTLAAADRPAVAETVVERPEPLDWKGAASDPGRATDPSSQAYWQRQDMRIWAQANPQLAKQAMAKAGADASWLSSPQMGEPKAPAAPEPSRPAVTPENRGALNGTQVGGPPPRGLQPYLFEIHADATAADGGRSGFIGSYLDRDNPLFQTINQAYGSYGPNHSRQWRGGDLGAPRRGLSIIETRAAGSGMNDPAQHEAAASRLLQTVLQDPEVKSGKRQLGFFVGHGDTSAPGAQGASGGDAPESAWNSGVFNALRRQVQQYGYKNFAFHEPIVDNDDQGANTNWARAMRLRTEWQQQQQGGL